MKLFKLLVINQMGHGNHILRSISLLKNFTCSLLTMVNPLAHTPLPCTTHTHPFNVMCVTS